MNKPLTMTIKETKSKLAEILNESELPLVILDLIMQTLYFEIHSLTEKQSLEEQKTYEDMMEENNIKNNNLEDDSE